MATKFKSIFKFSNDFISDSGSEYSPTYKEEFDKKGKRSLVISGKVNTYEKIQSFASDVDIYNILSRYFGGDVSALDQNKGFYADVTSIPRSFNEFHNKIVEGQNIYNGLPVDLKQFFGDDINQFMASIYNRDFESRYNDYLNSRVKRKFDVSSSDVQNNVNGGVSNESKSE